MAPSVALWNSWLPMSRHKIPNCYAYFSLLRTWTKGVIGEKGWNVARQEMLESVWQVLPVIEALVLYGMKTVQVFSSSKILFCARETWSHAFPHNGFILLNQQKRSSIPQWHCTQRLHNSTNDTIIFVNMTLLHYFLIGSVHYWLFTLNIGAANVVQ
jgi:hypothetical protein